MARGDARTDVELVEDDDDATTAPGGATPQPPAARASGADDEHSPATRRRALVIGAALLAVLTVVAVVGQSVVASRERTRTAALADVPGLVDAVDGPVRVLRSGPDDGLLRSTDRTPAGLLVGSRGEADGAESVVAVDPADGTVVWRTELLAAGPTVYVPPGGQSVPTSGQCRPSGQDGALLVCLADDGVALLGRGTLTQVAPARTRLVVLDARDGAVVSDLTDAVGEPLVARSVAVVDDLVVLVGAGGPSAYVRAVRADGTVAWQDEFPSTTTTAYGSQVRLDALPGGVAVATRSTLRLLDATGAVQQEVPLRSDDRVRGTAGDAVVVEAPGEGTVVVRARGVVRVPGRWVQLDVDDGTAPGLLLTADDTGVRAWSPDGTRRWASDVRVAGSRALVLDGRVVLGSGTAVVALDAATGDRSWRTGDVQPRPGLATDGRYVFVLGEGGDAPTRVVALDAAAGGAAWRVDLPQPVDRLVAVLGVLTAFSFDDLDAGDGLRRVTVLG